MLDSRRLEDYLRLALHYGDFVLLPEDAGNIRVLNVKKLSGGETNNIYSFLLTFTKKGVEQRFDLVLKAYNENVSLWLKMYRHGEDVRQYIREFQALRSLTRVGFPVPAVYLCECDSFFLGYPFLIIAKETVRQESDSKLDYFSATLARLHNLNPAELGIKSLRFPKDRFAFARERQICLKHFLNETRHYRDLKKDFDYAIRWLESNADDNNCPQYCLIHGEYHPNHTIITNDKVLKVIDWEGVQIGDPAFDVGYAYHLVKFMCNEEKSNSGERAAEHFVSEYTKNFQGDISRRLEFYKVVGSLGLAMEVSSWISNPLEAYRRFGYKNFVRSLSFPFLRSNFLLRNWLNADFFVSYLQYCQDFIKTTLRR